MYVQLLCENTTIGELEQPILKPPIAIGRETQQMPQFLGDESVTHYELIHKQVSRFHALITVINQQIFLIDKSANGTFINGNPIHQTQTEISSKDTIRIGPYKITVLLVQDTDQNSTEINHPQPQTPIYSNPLFLSRNHLTTWLIGISLMLLMSIGSLFLFTMFLGKYRPEIPQNTQIQEN